MQGIASTLDSAYRDRMAALCRELERELGLNYACLVYPHITYQVAEAYDMTPTLAALRALAQQFQPFMVRTAGLGIFTGEAPVLYINVVRDAGLSAFHDQVFATVAPYASGVHAHHFGHDQWVPHITLAAGDLTHEMLPEIIRLFSRRNFAWEITLNDLALVLDAAGTREDWVCLPLGDAAASPQFC